MMSAKNEEMKRETEAYLAKIRATVREGKQLISQAELRMAETDRLLEEQGLTREQVLNFEFTEEQKKVVNAELIRRGLPPLEEPSDSALQAGGLPPTPDAVERDGSSENRRKKFGVMMQQFRM